MSRNRLLTLLAATALLAVVSSCKQHSAAADNGIDPGLAKLIAQIPAIDNHAHPVLSPPLDASDRDFDALPVVSLEPQSDPLALRPDFPELGDAWKALYGFNTPPPLDADGMKHLLAARNEVKRREGRHYPAWVLDQANIGTMLANRVTMGNGVEAPRFAWIPYADALIFPLENSGMAAVTPDREAFFQLEDNVRARLLKKVGLTAPPSTLEAYLSKVITPTLTRQKENGAVAEKFEVAYLRSFDFTNPTQADAAEIYARWVSHGTPGNADYKIVQDFLFRYIARECGRLGLAVHLHSEAGAGSYFSIAGVNPLLLEPLFNDKSLRKTNFVLLHGGWPYEREIEALLQKPNVYLDFSSQDLEIPPHTEARWMREWLEFEPEKVLFGTDGYPYSDTLDWPEATWIAAHNGREALGIALSGMLANHEISRERARRIARLVLRGNAERLYHLAPPAQ